MMVHEPDPDSPLGRFQQRARRVPIPIRAIFVIVPIALTLYCVVDDSGPYALLADAQASVMDGEHYIVLSGGVTLLLFLLPSLVVIQLLAGLFKDPNAGQAQAGAQPPYPPQQGQHGPFSPHWQPPQPGQEPPPPGQYQQGPYPPQGPFGPP
jgi:hypothetical protein